MTRRTINLLAVAAAVAVVVWIGSGLIVDASPGTPSVSPPDRIDPAPSSVPAAEASPSPSAIRTRDLRGYALSIPEIDGMPRDLAPGDELEVWVAWDPPLTRRPQIEPLIDRVVYERTIAPTVPGEPPVAVILVPPAHVDELMWGDRYGALSVAVIER